MAFTLHRTTGVARQCQRAPQYLPVGKSIVAGPRPFVVGLGAHASLHARTRRVGDTLVLREVRMLMKDVVYRYLPDSNHCMAMPLVKFDACMCCAYNEV